MKSDTESRRGISFGYIFLILYLGIIFFKPQQFFPALDQIRIAYSSGLLVLCWAIFTTPNQIKRNVFGSRLFVLFVLFFLLCSLSLLVSDVANVKGQGDIPFQVKYPVYMQLLKATCLFLTVALIVRTEIDFIRLCWILVIFTAIDATITTYFYHLGALPMRMTSYFGGLGRSGPNAFSLLMLVMLPFPVVLLQQKLSKVQKVFLGFAFLNFIYCITRTRSRAGFLGLMFVLACFAVYRYVNWKLFLVIVMFVAFVFVKSPVSYFMRIETILDDKTYDQDYNVTSRISQYERALTTIQKHPFFGVGIGNFPAYTRLEFLHSNEERAYVIHNTFLEIGAECGIPAAVVFCAMIVLGFRQLREFRESLLTGGREGEILASLLNAIRIALVGYACIAMTLSFPHHRIFIILIALTISCQGLISEQHHNVKSI